jgi:hypothetical protein
LGKSSVGTSLRATGRASFVGLQGAPLSRSVDVFFTVKGASMPAKPFPTALLRIVSTKLYDVKGLVIMGELASFEHDPEETGTLWEEDAPSLGFDPLDTGGRLSRDLEGAMLRFPVNPEPGYWEGNLGLLGEMVPLDVTEVAFSLNGADEIVARLTTQLVFDPGQTGQTPYANTEWLFDLHLPVETFDDILSGRVRDRAAAAKQTRLARKLAERKQKI